VIGQNTPSRNIFSVHGFLNLSVTSIKTQFIFNLSFKEAEDVQECFKHLEAWYDENVGLKMKLKIK